MRTPFVYHDGTKCRTQPRRSGGRTYTDDGRVRAEWKRQKIEVGSWRWKSGRKGLNGASQIGCVPRFLAVLTTSGCSLPLTPPHACSESRLIPCSTRRRRYRLPPSLALRHRGLVIYYKVQREGRKREREKTPLQAQSGPQGRRDGPKAL